MRSMLWRCLGPVLGVLVLSGGIRGVGATPETKVSYTAAYGGTGTQPELDPANDLPRVPPTAPSAASATFVVKRGFRLELAAAEPEVVSPVTLAFDEFGRMFVVEMIDYSERRDETPHSGRIRRLEDTDGDGRYDRSVVFADNLPWPTALICSKGGVFVGATPDIVWLKDLDGDGRADERKVVFTGFASGSARLNVQALLNSFNWGLDNRIHGATGPIGAAEVLRADGSAGKPLELRSRDFSFDPRTFDIRPEAGGGQYGLSFDTDGRKFVCSNSDHLQMILYSQRYADRNPAVSMPGPRLSIAVDGPAAEVFRISPDEPWRIVRTRWRISGVVPGAVEGGGRVSGYFTGATGATIYRGDAYGPEFVDNAFIGDAGGNLIHRKILKPAGVALQAERPSDERSVEFVASRDTWFRPVHFQNGPDGCLYVADMYREVIEHPWSIPESIKKHLDLNSGNDRGRIWRIVPEGFRRPSRPLPGTLDVAGRVAALESDNGWTRETAARLLFEAQDPRAVPGLERLLLKSSRPLARLHALYGLEGLSVLSAKRHLVPVLDDPDERVREHAIALAERRLQNSIEGPILVRALARRVEDPAIRVRFQLALTLGEMPLQDRIPSIVGLARRDAGDPWIPWALLSSLSEGAAEVFVASVRDRDFLGSPAGLDWIRRLTTLIGAQGRTSEIREVLDWVMADGNEAVAFQIATAVLDGARRSPGPPGSPVGRQRLERLAALARSASVDAALPEARRIEAIRLLAHLPDERTRVVLEPVLAGGPEPLRREAIRTLARATDDTAPKALLQGWSGYPNSLRNEVLNVLVSRRHGLVALLEAVESGALPRSDLPAAVIQSLRATQDVNLAARVGRLFPPAPDAAARAASFAPALSLEGDAQRGRMVYRERCASCHRSGADGVRLGPDLVTVRSAGRDRLLASILNPHTEVAPQYVAFQVETRDGEQHVAVIERETPSAVTLRMGGGQEITLPRSQVRSMTSSGQSLMPEGLADGLPVQSMADLLEFIANAEPPASGR